MAICHALDSKNGPHALDTLARSPRRLHDDGVRAADCRSRHRDRHRQRLRGRLWWPAIGGLAIGLGGLVFPEALGVGYDIIGGFLQSEMSLRIVIGVLLVKSAMWAFSLGSGTSGGVLAPLLMMGAALGGL